MVTDGNCQSTIKYRQSPRGKDFKGFSSSASFQWCCLRKGLKYFDVHSATEALLKIPKYQILQAQGKISYKQEKSLKRPKRIASLHVCTVHAWLCGSGGAVKTYSITTFIIQRTGFMYSLTHSHQCPIIY